jgi:hypothetical protein
MSDINATIAELRALEARATPAPWCIESCGEKGDGSNMIGVAYDPDDNNCERPMSGWLPISRPVTGEFIEYYRDELVAECEHRNRNSHCDASLIVAARNAILPLCEEVDTLRQQLAKAGAQWRCFHCNLVFTDKEEARKHFGFWSFDATTKEPECVKFYKQWGASALAVRYEAIRQQLDQRDAEIARLREALQRIELGCSFPEDDVQRAVVKTARQALGENL